MKPDYCTARDEAGFSWSVGSSQGALRGVTGIPIREFNLKPEACIEAYRRGRPLIRQMFGEDVGLPRVTTPAISYGHVNCLGSELIFPVGGEVGHTHIYDSLQEGIDGLGGDVDWAERGMAPFYLEFREKLQDAFPDESVGLSFGLEGPITTAYELRGDSFFTDIFDDLEMTKQFMEATVDSILSFHEFLCEVRGTDPVSSSGAGMCDDLSSFIPPRLWPELVLPYWEQYYNGMTTGSRHAHVENLRAPQLPFLEDIGLIRYDPSISQRLNPQIIFRNCRVPFVWRLGSQHYAQMTCRDIEDFVYQSCADGASGVITYVAEVMWDEEHVEKVHAFIRAGKDAQRLFEQGCSRDEIGAHVSTDGQRKLWEGWCGYMTATDRTGTAR